MFGYVNHQERTENRMNQIDTVYTIGHSTQSFKEFLHRLERYHINCVVDVRSTPYSQYASQFNARDIKHALNNEGIQYIYMGKEFGARRDNPDLYDAQGGLDFAKTAKDSEFIRGVERIENGIASGYTIALMCTEKEPQDCHRCILVARALQDTLKANVENILIDGNLRNQREVEHLLVEKYFPERDQVSFFDTDALTDDEYISKAYEIRGKEIAYHMQAG